MAWRQTQYLRRQHWRERERHDTGHDYCSGHRDPELVEQPAGGALQKGERREHRHQRDGRRNDRKCDLARALPRRRFRILSQLLLVSIGVLEHYDRIVDDDSDRQRQSQKCEIVDREAKEVHHPERRDDRCRNRQAGDQRRAQIAQEEEDDRHHQPGGNQERFLRL